METLPVMIGGSPSPLELLNTSFFGDIYGRLRNSQLSFYSMPITANTYISSTEGMFPAIDALRSEIAAVRESMARHEKLLEKILAAVESNVPEIEIEDIPDDQARERILSLFKESGISLFYDEIAERLKLSLRQTVEVCNQLERDGLIGEPVHSR